jgi:hypothetical protein
MFGGGGKGLLQGDRRRQGRQGPTRHLGAHSILRLPLGAPKIAVGDAKGGLFCISELIKDPALR